MIATCVGWIAIVARRALDIKPQPIDIAEANGWITQIENANHSFPMLRKRIYRDRSRVRGNQVICAVCRRLSYIWVLLLYRQLEASGVNPGRAVLLDSRKLGFSVDDFAHLKIGRNDDEISRRSKRPFADIPRSRNAFR